MAVDSWQKAATIDEGRGKETRDEFNRHSATGYLQPATSNKRPGTGNQQPATGDKRQKTIMLEVYDNGTGFPEDMDFRKTSSLGLHLVTTLVRQVHGEIEMSREKGTCWRVKF